MKQYIGLDVHKQYTLATILDEAGGVQRQLRFRTRPADLRAFAQCLGPQDAVALESTTNAAAVHGLLARHAGAVVISNPLQTKAIATARVKTDKVDSTVLAQLLRTGFLPTVWMPDEHTAMLRQRCGHRQALVRQRTAVKNRIHAILHRNLVARPNCTDLFGARGKAWLQTVQLPEHERWQLDQELALYEFLGAQIAAAEEAIAKRLQPRRDLELLLSLPGVGFQVAVGMLATIGDVTRFAAAKKLVSYLGLNPRVRQSGERSWTGPISRCGRSHARWLLVEAAHAAVRVPGPLRAFYTRLRRRKGHNKAIVATARKLCTIIWYMLSSGEPYRWSPPVRTQEKIRRFQILAGAPKRTTGPKKGQPSQGGRAAYLARRKADHDAAKAAEAEYKRFLRERTASQAERGS